MSSLGILLQAGMPASVVRSSNHSRRVDLIGNVNFSGVPYTVHAPGAMGSLFRPQVLALGSNQAYIIRPIERVGAATISGSAEFIPEINPFEIPFEKLESAMNSMPLQSEVRVQLEAGISRPGKSSASLILPFGRRADDSPREAVIRIQLQRGLWALSLKHISKRTSHPEHLLKALSDQWLLIRAQTDQWLAEYKASPNKTDASRKLIMIRAGIEGLVRRGIESPHFHDWMREINNFLVSGIRNDSGYRLVEIGSPKSGGTVDFPRRLPIPGQASGDEVTFPTDLFDDMTVPKGDPVPEREVPADETGSEVIQDPQADPGEPVDDPSGENIDRQASFSEGSEIERLDREIEQLRQDRKRNAERLGNLRQNIQELEEAEEELRHLLLRRRILEKRINQREQIVNDSSSSAESISEANTSLEEYSRALDTVNSSIEGIEENHGNVDRIRAILKDLRDEQARRQETHIDYHTEIMTRLGQKASRLDEISE